MHNLPCSHRNNSLLPEFTGGYLFGFQGQETDPEDLSGAVSFKYRVHDARLGRFLSVDPLIWKFAWNSPYAFSENRLVDGREFEGLEFVDQRVDIKSQYLAKGGVVTKEEVVVAVTIAAIGIGAVAVIILGPEIVGAFILEELSEEAFESVTGIPVLIDPFDVVQKGLKELLTTNPQQIVKSLKDFRQSLVVASKSIRFDKRNHIINGSNGKGHGWENLVDDPQNTNFDAIEMLIQETTENGIVISKGDGFVSIIHKKDNNWIEVNFGTNPTSGEKVINDAWVVTDKAQISKYDAEYED